MVATGVVRSTGLAIAIGSSLAFALSGPLAKPLLDAGWSSGGTAMVRIGGAAVVLLVPTLILIARSRGRTLVGNVRFLVGYGVFPIAGAQLGFFSAIQTLPVGVALLIEYLAPVFVVLWLWLRRGQRPGRLTVLGGVAAMLGLFLVLDISGGTSIDPVGVAWALMASFCVVVYFLLSATVADELSPVLVIGVGMIVGWLVLAGAALIGVLPVLVTTTSASLAGATLPWWVFATGLVLVATVLAYLTGIIAVGRLGARLASFVALSEVVFAAGLSWLLLAQTPNGRQLLGGALILAGVVLVRLGEPAADPLAEAVAPEPDPAVL